MSKDLEKESMDELELPEVTSEETTEGETVEQESQPTVEELLSKLQQLENDYKHLQRAYTKAQQANKRFDEDKKFIDYIRGDPELMNRINELVREYSEETGYRGRQRYDMKEIKEAMKFLVSQPDYVKYEGEIIAYAEIENYDIDNPIELKKAYLLWRGENIDRIIKDRYSKQMTKITEKKKKVEETPQLQGSGSNYTPKEDYTKMTDAEYLKSLKARGMQVYTDE